MNIDDPTILSWTRSTMNALLRDPKQWDGDCLLAFRFDDHNIVFDDILILSIDAYSEQNDPFLMFDGNIYNWEIDLYTVQGVRDFHVANNDDFTVDELVQSLKYYIEFDAYYDERQSVGGKYRWGGGRLPLKRDPKEFRFQRGGERDT